MDLMSKEIRHKVGEVDSNWVILTRETSFIFHKTMCHMKKSVLIRLFILLTPDFVAASLMNQSFLVMLQISLSLGAGPLL